MNYVCVLKEQVGVKVGRVGVGGPKTETLEGQWKALATRRSGPITRVRYES